jgi:hypothetical protein
MISSLWLIYRGPILFVLREALTIPHLPFSKRWITPKEKGNRSSNHSKPEYAPVFQVDVFPLSSAVSPLYLWERARVRAGPKPGKT